MTNPAQRRIHPRNPFHCFAHYRLLDSAPAASDLLCVTKDFSHEGLYFMALEDHLRLNMQLVLKFPYLDGAAATDRECLVEVVRTHDLYPGRYGVGVRLLGFRNPTELPSGLVIPNMEIVEAASHISIDLYA
jgi:hypothetical protein